MGLLVGDLFVFFFLFKVEQLLLHEAKHLTVKTGAPMLVSADVSLQNRFISLGKKHLTSQ